MSHCICWLRVSAMIRIATAVPFIVHGLAPHVQCDRAVYSAPIWAEMISGFGRAWFGVSHPSGLMMLWL
jgi:hypothetical protein